jgi:hypothetical protein
MVEVIWRHWSGVGDVVLRFGGLKLKALVAIALSQTQIEFRRIRVNSSLQVRATS